VVLFITHGRRELNHHGFAVPQALPDRPRRILGELHLK